MTKAELIETLTKKQLHLNKTDIDLAVDCIFEQMSQALIGNQRIEIRGFGTFTLRRHGPRRGRNPFSGEILKLPTTYSIHFKPGKELRQRVANSRVNFQLEKEEVD